MLGSAQSKCQALWFKLNQFVALGVQQSLVQD
jgi:hypothetical protein